ncbi:MAG: response regulator [Clostridia bacterium]|nr:response regulator [Clostridia bacterium]
MDLKVEGSKIVIADDSVTILSKLEMLLKRHGYQVYKAYDGRQSLQVIDEVNPDLIILDLDMPYLNGLEVCKIVKNNEKTSLTPVIIITSSGIKEDKNSSISAGANDFLNKADDTLELTLKVESLLKLKHAIDQLENANNIIKSLAKAVEVKDKYTVGHAERVSLFATKIGKKMGLDEQQLKDITMAGLLHDIGKIGVPDLILNKPGRLTDEEFGLIQNHPVIGEEICSPIKSFDKVKRIIRHHHEKLNGRGYPDRIGSSEINIETRIMTVADIYDAVTSDRSYRKAMTKQEAFAILRESVSRGELDGQVVDAFDEVVE